MLGQTQTAAVVEDYEVGTLIEDKPKVDPRVVRWGIQFLRGLSLDPRKSSVRATQMPVAKFFPITTFDTPQEYFTMDEYKEKEITVEVLAEHAEKFIEGALGIWGFKSLFYSETNKATIAAIGATLIPKLSEIREIGKALESNPIGKFCLGADENDLGEPREYCATCILTWLKSDECLAYMEHVAENGIAVHVPVSGVLSAVTVRPQLERLEYARAAIQQGLEQYIRKSAEDWARVIGELDAKKRSEVKDLEHAIRKDLHEPKPANKEIEAASRMATAQAEATSEVFDRLAETTDQLARSQSATNEVLAGIVQQNQMFMQYVMSQMQGGNFPQPPAGASQPGAVVPQANAPGGGSQSNAPADNSGTGAPQSPGGPSAKSPAGKKTPAPADK